MNKEIKEVWKNIDGYEHYQVSSLGNIRSLPRYIYEVSGKRRMKKGIILAQSNTSTGYKKVELVDELGNRKSYKVHRLVAQAFIPNFSDKPNINHKDTNPHNNNVENLEWCTQKENVDYSIEIGNKKYARDFIDHNELIRDYLEGMGTNHIAAKHNTCKTVVYGILKQHSIEIRSQSQCRDKYKIDLEQLLKDLKLGMKNHELAKKYNCSLDIIATRKYQFRKRGLL